MLVKSDIKEADIGIPMSPDKNTHRGAQHATVDETPDSNRKRSTRSQSGHSTKRRRQERSLSPEGRESLSGAGLRSGTHKQHKSYDGAIFSTSGSSTANSTAASSEHERSSVGATSVDSECNEPPAFPPTTQITFLDGSLSATANSRSDRPGPKSRANLPVPVPNLTKKSRGRRVPTKLVSSGDDSAAPSAGAKEGRMYVCQVENCGKCFHRGEHLKRHIRSIHTHEKPFKCSHGLCTKTFNRHDNLLQHLKVHKGREISPDPSDMEDGNEYPPYRPREETASPSPPSSPRVIPPPPRARLIPIKAIEDFNTDSRDTSPAPEAHEYKTESRRRSPSPPPPPRPSAPTSFRTITSSFSSGSGRYAPHYGTLTGPGTSPFSSSANNASRMAVSSLRTEMDMQESPLRRLCELAVSSPPVRGQEA